MPAAAAFENVLAIASAALGAVTAAVATFVAARTARATRDAVKRVQETGPDAAMSSLNLKELGDYVYDTLGTIPITEYAANPVARADVAHALERIERFVSQDESTSTGEQDGRDPARWRAQGLRALESGDVWQALAQLRRAIELELRTIAERRDIPVPRRVGAGGLLAALARSGGLSEEAVGPLKYAIDVANRAIHGEDIPPGVAYEAFEATESALRRLTD
jgi:hypothetical protein